MPHETLISTSQAADPAAGYDRIAEEYARLLCNELDDKPFDREFLSTLAAEVAGGPVLDLGCGPGHVGRHLQQLGVPVVGLDISPEMIRIARSLYPGIAFNVGDMRRIAAKDGSFAGVVAFYAIIHLHPMALKGVFTEVRRVLAPQGVFALSFHVGHDVVHVDELWGVKTSLDFTFFEPTIVERALKAAGFQHVQTTTRPPYAPAVEAQTNRCYIKARIQAVEGGE